MALTSKTKLLVPLVRPQKLSSDLTYLAIGVSQVDRWDVIIRLPTTPQSKVANFSKCVGEAGGCKNVWVVENPLSVHNYNYISDLEILVLFSSFY